LSGAATAPAWHKRCRQGGAIHTIRVMWLEQGRGLLPLPSDQERSLRLSTMKYDKGKVSGESAPNLCTLFWRRLPESFPAPLTCPEQSVH
jgi:hypothetical protein